MECDELVDRIHYEREEKKPGYRLEPGLKPFFAVAAVPQETPEIGRATFASVLEAVTDAKERGHCRLQEKSKM